MNRSHRTGLRRSSCSPLAPPSPPRPLALHVSHASSCQLPDPTRVFQHGGKFFCGECHFHSFSALDGLRPTAACPTVASAFVVIQGGRARECLRGTSASAEASPQVRLPNKHGSLTKPALREIHAAFVLASFGRSRDRRSSDGPPPPTAKELPLLKISPSLPRGRSHRQGQRGRGGNGREGWPEITLVGMPLVLTSKGRGTGVTWGIVGQR